MRAGIPDLRGAACRGHPELFGVADRHDTSSEGGLHRLPAATSHRPGCGPAYEPRPRAPSSRDRATDWLRGYLAQRGPVVSTRVIADATAAGISLSTLRKARIDLNVRLQRVSGVGARHTWI